MYVINENVFLSHNQIDKLDYFNFFQMGEL